MLETSPIRKPSDNEAYDSVEVEENRRKMNERAHPFIGHEGVGSKISVGKKTDRLILKESGLGQLIVIVSLLLFGPGLTASMIIKRHDPQFLKTPWPILAILVFFSCIGWVFGAKYLFRMVAGRRIEVRIDKGTVSMYAAGRRPQRELSREDVAGFDIFSTWYPTDSDSVENFTLRLKCRDGGTVELCTSDSKKNIEFVKSAIENTIS
jgi:hypothetical protein